MKRRSKQSVPVSAPDEHPVEILSFSRGDNLATIATDGTRHVSEEIELVKEHKSLSAAISYLEAKGYSIRIDGFESV